MPQNIVTPTKIAAETLRILHNNSAFLGNVSRDLETEYRSPPKPGATVTYRRPVQFTVRSGAAASLQDVNETTGTLTVQPELGIDWTFSDFDMKMSIEQFSDRYLKPAGTRLAAELDLRIAQSIIPSVGNFAGTPGTPPATVANILDAAALLDENACPRDGRRMMALNPRANASVVGGLSGLFNMQQTIGEQNKTGLMRTNLGLDFVMSQNLPTHTVGPLGGTPLVNGANQGLINASATDNVYAATTSLVTDGWTASAALRLNAGDVITIAGVFAVNPESRQSTGQLRQFVVTANASSDGSGNATLVISPAIIAGGSYQNVTARPADNAAITVVSGSAGVSYGQNILWHPDAISMVNFPMEVPNGMDMASQVTYEGVSLRFVRGFDILNNRRICRFDLLYGVTVNRPEWVVRRTN
jgi:hypothetical protein